jgi:hypothetical protein
MVIWLRYPNVVINRISSKMCTCNVLLGFKIQAVCIRVQRAVWKISYSKSVTFYKIKSSISITSNARGSDIRVFNVHLLYC